MKITENTENTVLFDFLFGSVPEISFTTYSFDEGDKEMSWNYRVVFDPVLSELDNVGEYTIREVFYDEDDEIRFWSGDAAVPNGNSYEELQEDMAKFQEAFELPCLMSIIDEETGEEVLVEWVDDIEEDVDIADNDE